MMPARTSLVAKPWPDDAPACGFRQAKIPSAIIDSLPASWRTPVTSSPAAPALVEVPRSPVELAGPSPFDGLRQSFMARGAALAPPPC